MKYFRFAILVTFLLGLIFWLHPRGKSESASALHPIKPTATAQEAKPVTMQVAKPVLAAVNPAKPSAPTAADLPANFDPRAKIAKDEMHEWLQGMAEVANEGLTPEREKGDPEIWIISEEITALLYKYSLDATPVLNDAGDIATYTVDDAVWKQMKDLMAASKDPPNVTEPPTLRFIKINGEWQEIEEDPEKDPFAGPSDYLPQLLHPELVIK